MTAVIVPAYNAENSLPRLIAGIEAFIPVERIVLVDDGSKDRTAALAESLGVVVLRHSTNRGKGAALRTGIEHVLGNEGFDSAITMDADMQHDPNDLPAFIEAWSAQKADILLGCRQRFGRGMPLHRILSNTITSALVSAKTGVKIPDSQTGYRMIGRRVLESVQFVSDGYEAETEFLLKAARRGCRISSVPIATIYTGATSHMTHWRTTWRFLQVLLREYE